jgi:hypothetical protein
VGDSKVIYRIWPVEGDYEWIEMIDIDSVDVVDMLGNFIPLLPHWKPLKVRRVHPTSNRKKAVEADFPWYGSHLLFMRPRAVEVLRPILIRSAEILPVKDEDSAELYAINATNVVDALDEARSELKHFKDGEVMRVIRHEFRPEVIVDLDMFRIVQFRASDIFVSQAFVDTVENRGLTGIRFEAVWSSTEG